MLFVCVVCVVCFGGVCLFVCGLRGGGCLFVLDFFEAGGDFFNHLPREPIPEEIQL